MKKNLIYLLLVPVSFLLLAGCEKTIDDLKETTVSAEDVAISETAISSAFDVIDDVSSTDGRMQKNASSILPEGVIILFTDSSYDDGNGVSLSIDFGTDPILCRDGKTRSGKILVTASKPYTEVGCVIEARFNEENAYHVGTGSELLKVLGTITATRTGTESVNIVVANGKISGEKDAVEFFSDRTLTRTSGNDIPGSYGDIYEISGTGGGKNRNGEAFETNITKTLVKKIEDGCANTFVEGVIELKNAGSGRILKIDFDPNNDAACDKLVRITLPGGIKKDLEIN
jgi:hypothetical protein